MIGLEGKTLHSSRLSYRLLIPEDAPALRELLDDPAVTEPSGFLPAANAAEFDAWFRELTQWNSAVAVLREDRLIGYCHVSPYDPGPTYAGKRCHSFGFVIGRIYQGFGYGTEMLRTMTDYMRPRTDYLFADHFEGNLASSRVIQKCGYRYFESYTMFFDTLGCEKLCRSYVTDCTIGREVTCREVAAEDVMDILLKMSADWAKEHSCRGYFANTEADIQGKRVFLAYDGQEPVAYLLGTLEPAASASSVMIEGTPCFEVDEIYVAPRLRSHGIGTKLFRYAEQTVAADADYILLSTATKNWKAILHFYIEELDMSFWSARLFRKIPKK